MSSSIDARVPVVFGDPAAAGPGDVLLTERDGMFCGDGRGETFVLSGAVPGQPAQAIGCACCTPRSAAAAALGRLFLARARGQLPFFRRVVAVATPVGQQAIRAALAQDPLAAGRFRLG